MDLESLQKLHRDTLSQIDSFTTEYEKKVKEKTSIVTKHKQYYGNKCHELLNEMLSRQPTDPESGNMNSLSLIIKTIKIDAEKIQFIAEDEDFKSF